VNGAGGFLGAFRRAVDHGAFFDESEIVHTMIDGNSTNKKVDVGAAVVNMVYSSLVMAWHWLAL
jgi:hypothetical protein